MLATTTTDDEERDGPRACPMANSPASANIEHRIVVPTSLSMVSLLGSGDELLRVVEQAFPTTDIHVRGNEITLAGPAQEVAFVEGLVDELVAVLRTGQGLSVESVSRSVAMLRSREASPAEVLTHNILSSRGWTIRPKTLNQKRYV
ncbi:MAG: PhoH family protein, partial [Actinomycetes bacterium]